MEDGANDMYILVSKTELEDIRFNIQKILDLLSSTVRPFEDRKIQTSFDTAVEFMQAVRIRRTKFDELVAKFKIKTIKKKRKIYLPVTEIERFFKDPDIK